MTETEAAAEVITWARGAIMRVRRVSTDDRVRRSLKTIALALCPKVNPRIAFLEKDDAKTR